jgi:hypothetical protein
MRPSPLKGEVYHDRIAERVHGHEIAARAVRRLGARYRCDKTGTGAAPTYISLDDPMGAPET